MAFNHQQYNAQYLLNIRNSNEVINDAASKYGVQVVPANVAEGETYWRVIGVHHLLPRENFSKHSVFVEALDEEGRRMRNPHAWAGWTWRGRQPNERADPVPLDKPDSEPAGNIAMHFGQVISVWMKGLSRDADVPSDRVENLHTAHPDEPTPDGALLNTLGHHSFYVVFQRTLKAATMTEGVISGRIERGRGQTVRLFKAGELVSKQVIDQTMTFQFENLSTGVYRLEIGDTDISQDDIRLTAGNERIHLELAIPLADDSAIFGPVEKSISHYLLLGPPTSRGRRLNLLLALDYMLTFSVTVGFSVVEAKQAHQVTIIGPGISATDQQAIKDAGSQLEILGGDAYDIEAQLRARIQAGRAFGG